MNESSCSCLQAVNFLSTRKAPLFSLDPHGPRSVFGKGVCLPAYKLHYMLHVQTPILHNWAHVYSVWYFNYLVPFFNKYNS